MPRIRHGLAGAYKLCHRWFKIVLLRLSWLRFLSRYFGIIVSYLYRDISCMRNDIFALHLRYASTINSLPVYSSFTCHERYTVNSYPKSTRTQSQLIPKSTRTKSTRTQVNSYPSQLVTTVNSYPSQLAPKVNSYPNAKETQSNVIIILVIITA